MEQVTDDNQGSCDAWLRGESHMEWSFLVSFVLMFLSCIRYYDKSKYR